MSIWLAVASAVGLTVVGISVVLWRAFRWHQRETTGARYFGRPIAERRALKLEIARRSRYLVPMVEVLSRIKATEELKDLPVVILTTSKADADKLEAYSDGIDGYIVKPLTLDGFGILLNVIAMVLRR